MQELILVRYGEIFLKGLNRPYFMRELVRRVREAVSGQNAKVQLHDSRILVTGFNDMDACINKIKKVFGVHSVCPALELDKEDREGLAAVALTDGLSGTFKVSSRRSDKNYSMDSMQISAWLGGRVLQAHPSLRVDVHHPEHVLNVEIRDQAYMYCRVIPAVGGMPVGTNGAATLLLSGGIDSPVAGWMVAKRGVKLSAVHFNSPPYTSERAKQKVLDLAKILSESCCGLRVYVVPFTKIQLAIYEQCPEEYTTLIMRRLMMRIAEKIARREGSGALVTGESIGQVASQTMEALGATDCAVEMPVFRPLIGFDKSEIIEIAEKIGTYETSSLPYEDCCTVFTPKHPATRPRKEQVLAAEAQLKEIDEMLEEALAGTELIKC